MPILIIDKIKPANGGNFPMVDAQDVAMPDGTRLDQVMPIFLSQSDYDALVEAEQVDEKRMYMIVEESV